MSNHYQRTCRIRLMTYILQYFVFELAKQTKKLDQQLAQYMGQNLNEQLA